MQKKSVIALLLFLVNMSAGATEFDCGPPTRPYLQILEYRSIADIGIPPPHTSEERSGSLLCRDRRTSWVLLGSYPESVQPVSAAFFSGRIALPDWREITAAAQAARIGVVGSCRLRAELVADESYEGELTWHGTGTRRNTFRLSSADLSLPVCSAAVERLWIALQRRKLEAGADSFMIGDLALPIGR